MTRIQQVYLAIVKNQIFNEAKTTQLMGRVAVLSAEEKSVLFSLIKRLKLGTGSPFEPYSEQRMRFLIQ